MRLHRGSKDPEYRTIVALQKANDPVNLLFRLKRDGSHFRRFGRDGNLKPHHRGVVQLLLSGVCRLNHIAFFIFFLSFLLTNNQLLESIYQTPVVDHYSLLQRQLDNPQRVYLVSLVQVLNLCGNISIII